MVDWNPKSEQEEMESMTQETTAPIIDLLSRAGAAHHTYEQTILQGVYDQNWPTWYAEYAIEHGLNALLQGEMTVEQLGRFFRESICDYRVDDRGGPGDDARFPH